MKKVFSLAAIVLIAFSMAAFARDNSWYVVWMISGALDPVDDPNNLTGILQNYDLTWDLLYSTSADGSNAQVLGTRQFASGADSYTSSSALESYITEAPKFDSLLSPLSPGNTYIIPVASVTGADTTSSYFFQKITVTDGTDSYEWQSDVVKVTASDAEIPPAGEPMNGDAVIGLDADQQWTKVTAVPEPTTMALLGLGGLAMVLRRRIRR